MWLLESVSQKRKVRVDPSYTHPCKNTTTRSTHTAIYTSIHIETLQFSGDKTAGIVEKTAGKTAGIVADKGSAIVVDDTSTYIANGRQHLSDTNTYKQLTTDTTETIATNITTYLNELKDAGLIDETEHEYLCPPNPTRTQIIYFLKKIHKTPPQIRPIVSGCSGPTANISRFLDNLLKPAVLDTPSFLLNSTHLIEELRNIRLPPTECHLFTMDVKSLYTNIPQQEAISVLLQYNDTTSLPKHVLRKLLTFILRDNVFTFAGDF